MKLLFAGTPEVALPSLQALIEHPVHEVVAVLTRPPARAGRGRALTPSPVAAYAEQHGVAVFTPTSPEDPSFLAAAAELGVECAPVVAYGALLRQASLALPRHGWINLHFSLLPAWRGAAPVQHALLHGDEFTGASTFRIGPGLDDGPVFGVLTERIRPEDTSATLLQRLAEAGSGLLVATLDGIADGSLHPVAQSADGVCLAPKLTVADGEIRFTEPALAVSRRIRACTPSPGAWAEHGGVRLKLGPVRILTDPPTGRLAPGRLLVSKHSVVVGTATDPVELGEVQPPGKRPMPATDWVRGARLTSGDQLG